MWKTPFNSCWIISLDSTHHEITDNRQTKFLADNINMSGKTSGYRQNQNSLVFASQWVLLFLGANHHHDDVSSAQISLILSRHLSQSAIASGGSSGLHLISTQSCRMYARAGSPAFARPCEGVHKSKKNIKMKYFYKFEKKKKKIVVDFN